MNLGAELDRKLKGLSERELEKLMARWNFNFVSRENLRKRWRQINSIEVKVEPA